MESWKWKETSQLRAFDLWAALVASQEEHAWPIIQGRCGIEEEKVGGEEETKIR